MVRVERWLVWVMAGSVLHCGLAHAGDPGDRTFTPLGGGQIGSSINVGAKGNLAISLPVLLPAPRGSTPLPFSVSYNGSNVAGAAGVGWDIPIAAVTWQHNLSRRKPIHRFGGQFDPATADRVIVDIGNGPMLMAQTNTPRVYQPFGSGYYELRYDGSEFTGRDASGNIWTFARIPALFNDDFYPLASIVDVTGKNRVDYHYDVYDKFSPNPVQPPFRRDELSMRELALREITHSPDASGRCAKYTIRLNYVHWPETDTQAPYPHLLSVDFQAGRPRAHTLLLHTIEVHSAINTGCESFIVPTQRTYSMSYTRDALTGQPRLTKVDLFGVNDKGTNAGTALPVSGYQYGSPLVSGGLQYVTAEHFTLPAGPGTTSDGFLASLGTGPGALYGLVRSFQDLNGDGRADFVTLDAAAQKPVLALNLPSNMGNDFSTFNSQTNLSNSPAAPYNLGTPDFSFGLPVLEGVENTYQQVIDFNGDGRPDIIVATEGRNAAGKLDPNFWKVLINTPGQSGNPSDIVWLERQVDVTAVRAAIQSHHVLSLTASSDQSSKPLPVSRTIQVGAFAQNKSVESGVLTQWKLIDVNGDGFPDMVFDTDDVTAFNDSSCDSTGRCQPVLRQDHPPTTRLMVIYHTGPMMAGSGADTQNVWLGPPVELRADGACGVERLVWLGGGQRRFTCGFMEVNGDGIPDYVIQDAGGIRAIRSSGLAQAHDVRLPENQTGGYPQQEAKRAILLPGPVGLVNDPRSSVCGSDSTSDKKYLIEQQTELRDITGDGIADYIYFGSRGALANGTPILHASLTRKDLAGVKSWWFMPGTGVGFGAPVPIRTPGDLPFAIHVSEEHCNGQTSSVIASLQDIDGDGRPELIRVVSPLNVQIAKILGADGDLGAHGAGQVTAIDNRFGAVAHITYGSAKSEWLTRGSDPFPEIVVTQIQQTADRGLGSGLSPVRYAYGAPEIVYHPMLGRWIMAGYRQRVTMIGEPMATPSMIKGRAILSTSISVSDVPGDLNRLMLAGRATDIEMIAGNLPADPRLFVVRNPAFAPLSAEHISWSTQPLPGDVPTLVSLEEECYATPPVQSPGQFGDLVLCRRAATAYVAEQTAWQGAHPYPASDSVSTRTTVATVDPYGRPTLIHNEGDRSRADDDVCFQITYASPIAGSSLILDTLGSIHAHDCANTSRVLAGVRYKYDNLPEGQYRLGFRSGRALERHDLKTGGLLEVLDSIKLERDQFGNVVTVTRSRTDGATAITKIGFDPFGLRPTRTETIATGLAQPLVTQIDYDSASLLPLNLTNSNGATIHNTYDGFERCTRVSISLPGDDTRYVLADAAYNGFDSASTGRSIVFRTYHRWTSEQSAGTVDPATVTNLAAVFDEAGRAVRGILDLGSDYKQSLIIDSVLYDGLGRPHFAADPYPSGTSGQHYGVTLTYRPDGRPECSVSGSGPQTIAVTNEALNRYPNCLTYSYADNTLFVRTQGPNELASGKPQSGAYDEKGISATGQVVSKSRWKGAMELNRMEYAYDRLGALSTLTRWADAHTRTGAAAWNWTRDSLGRVLVTGEPAGLARQFSYDSWGNLSAIDWNDNTGIVSIGRGLKFAYDGLSRLIQSDETQNGQIVSGAGKEFTYDIASNDPAQVNPQFLDGRLSFAKSGGRSAFFSYDALGRLSTVSREDQGDPTNYAETTVVGPSGAVESLSLQLPDHTDSQERIVYEYDSARRLRAVNYEDGPKTLNVWRAISTDLFGRVLEAKFGNGASQSYSYRPEGRRELLFQRTLTAATKRFVEFRGYDGGMLLKGVSEVTNIPGASDITTTYTYDARNALAHALARKSGNTIFDESYTYDGLGNLHTIANSGATLEVKRNKFDPDRVCSVVPLNAPDAPCNYGYDAAGNVWQVRDTGGLFSYDVEGRLRTASRAGRRAQLDYEPFGSPASLKIVNTDGQRRERFYGANSRVDFFDTEGNPAAAGTGGFQHLIERQIVSPLGTLAVVRRADNGSVAVLYPISDFQGTRTVLASNGTAVESMSYKPFGAVTDTGDPKSISWWPYQWNGGRILDGFGLVALGNRTFDPRVGRFLQRDPLVKRTSGVSAHPYAFAMNDPINNSDPSGRDCIGVECGGFLAGNSLPTLGPINEYPPNSVFTMFPRTEQASNQEPNRETDEGPSYLVQLMIRRRKEIDAKNWAYMEWYYLNGGSEAVTAGLTTQQLDAINTGAEINSIPSYSTGNGVIEEDPEAGMFETLLAGKPNGRPARISVNTSTGVGLVNFIDPWGSDPQGSHVSAYNPLIVANNLPRGTLIGMAHGDDSLNGQLAAGVTVRGFLRGMEQAAQEMAAAGIPVRFCVGMVCGGGAANLLHNINVYFSPELGTGGFDGMMTNALRGVMDPANGYVTPSKMIYLPPVYVPPKP